MFVLLTSNFGYKVFKASIIFGYIWRNLGYFGVFCRFFLRVYWYSTTPPWPTLSSVPEVKRSPHTKIQLFLNTLKMTKKSRGRSCPRPFNLAQEFGISKQQISDIRKNKDKILKWAIPFFIRNPPLEGLYISPPQKNKLLTP